MFQQLLKNLAVELSMHRIAYMVIGGQAVLVYGEPRLTKDIDVTLGIDTEKLDKILLVVKKLKLEILVKDVERFVSETMVLPVNDAKSGIRIDFIFSTSFYERQAIKRAKRVKLANRIIRFASLEDLIIHKIISSRNKDIEDIKSILLINPHYDRRYIVKWLKAFDKSLNKNFVEIFKKTIKEL